MKHVLLTVATIASLMMIAQANASPITITSSNFYAISWDGISGSNVATDNSTTFGSRTVTATDGGSTSTTSINWTDTGTGALLDFNFDQTRTGAFNSYAQAHESSLYFTVNADTTYSLSGMFSATDVGSPGRVYSEVVLQDTASGMLFQDFSQSLYTANETFTLGVAGDGDVSNTTNGSLTGALLAGHNYRFYFNEFIQAYPSADQGASATGCVTLSIGGATGAGSCGISVPAPAPLALFGLGLLALGIRRKYV
jgi:hypothetical protein